MFVAPGTVPKFGYKLTRDAAEQIARNWWVLLLNGALLVVAGFLIFSIDWTIRSLATLSPARAAAASSSPPTGSSRARSQVRTSWSNRSA